MPSCLSNRAEICFAGCFPLGFVNEYAFYNFVFVVVNHADMPEDATLVFHGSSVTGVSHEKHHKPFDVGRISDFDIAIVSATLWKRAGQVGVGTRSSTARTGELQDEDLVAMRIQGVARRAQDLMGACSTKA